MGFEGPSLKERSARKECAGSATPELYFSAAFLEGGSFSRLPFSKSAQISAQRVEMP